MAALSLGLAQGVYEQSLAYARQRNAFGRPIAKFQAIQFKLADMETEIAAGRHLVYHAAWLKDQGRPYAHAASLAKLYTGELSHRVANEGSRSTAATATWTSSPSAASTATRRSSRSARAPTRCSGS